MTVQTEYGSATALQDEILRTVVGSGVHGLAIEGTDDHDEMGVFIETPEQVLGLAPPNDHYVTRTQPEGHRSGPGDVDLVLYSLRKYVRLAVKGNPTVLVPLFAPTESVLHINYFGFWLVNLRDQMLSKAAGHRFLGYMNSQMERLTGGGKRNRVPNRPELIAKYGFDTKYASHALRLAIQGHELIKTGHLTLPMPEMERQLVLGMKTGAYGYGESLAMISGCAGQAEAALADSPLPDEPNYPAVNKMLVDMHNAYWNEP